MHPGYNQVARGNNQAGQGITKGVKTSEESNHSFEVLMPRVMLRLVWLFPHASWP